MFLVSFPHLFCLVLVFLHYSWHPKDFESVEEKAVRERVVQLLQLRLLLFHPENFCCRYLHFLLLCYLQHQCHPLYLDFQNLHFNFRFDSVLDSAPDFHLVPDFHHFHHPIQEVDFCLTILLPMPNYNAFHHR